MSSKKVFNDNFMNFFQNSKISQNVNFEEGKHEWISICNITETTMHPCVCGHNVKHITYLFNEKNKHIVSVGTTCCKKYGLLEKHMKNELLIHVLREQISQHCFKNSGNLLSLEKDLGELLDNYIYEKFTGIMKQYSRDMDENNFYFDVFYPLNRMKDDILELKNYGYDFSKHYDEICEILREREIHNREIIEDSDSETNSVIMEKLDKIEKEISELLNENFSEITYFENENMDEEENIEKIEESSENEEISELLRENSSETSVLEKENMDVEENIRIEEEIKKEIEEEISKKEFEEKEAEEYLNNEDKEIEEAMNYYIERNTETDCYYIKPYTNYDRIYTESDLRIRLGIQELNMRIDKLKTGIEEYKKDFNIFNKNLEEYNKLIIEINRKVNRL